MYLCLRPGEAGQHITVRPLAEQLPLTAHRVPHQDRHPLADRIEGEHVEHFVLHPPVPGEGNDNAAGAALEQAAVVDIGRVHQRQFVRRLGFIDGLGLDWGE